MASSICEICCRRFGMFFPCRITFIQVISYGNINPSAHCTDRTLSCHGWLSSQETNTILFNANFFISWISLHKYMPMCLSFIASDEVRPRGLEWLIFNKAQNNYAKMFWDSSYSQAWIIAGNGNYTKFDFLKCVLLWSEPSWCSVCTLSVYQELLWSSWWFGMSSAVHDQINRLLNGLVGRFLSVL